MTLTAELGIEVELVEGAGGVFDVSFDGEVVFSKDVEGRFPETGEILTILEARVASQGSGGTQ